MYTKLTRVVIANYLSESNDFLSLTQSKHAALNHSTNELLWFRSGFTLPYVDSSFLMSSLRTLAPCSSLFFADAHLLLLLSFLLSFSFYFSFLASFLFCQCKVLLLFLLSFSLRVLIKSSCRRVVVNDVLQLLFAALLYFCSLSVCVCRVKNALERNKFTSVSLSAFISISRSLFTISMVTQFPRLWRRAHSRGASFALVCFHCESSKVSSKPLRERGKGNTIGPGIRTHKIF